MAAVLRGEVYWADLDPTRGREQAGRRPVLVVSQDLFNRAGTIIAVALTSQEPRAGYPLTLEVGGKTLPKRSWVKISQVRTLAVERLGDRIGTIPVEDVETVIDGLNELLGR